MCGGCNSTQWSCQDNRRCLKIEAVCDGIIHCTDGSDEKPELCALWQCPDGMWKCVEKKCIKERDVCDRQPNCLNNSDENSELCSDWNCSNGMFKCEDNHCINAWFVCDGDSDCIGDNSDEDPEMCLQWEYKKMFRGQ